MRLDCPLSPPIKMELCSFFKAMGCKQWLIGCEEKKKDSGKIHFHVACYLKQSENKVKKEFKYHIKSFPTWEDSNSFSCCMKKKEKKCILKNKKKYKKDIDNIIAYPIKEVKDITSWLLLKHFRGIPKKLIIELYEKRQKLNEKQILVKKKKTKTDFEIMWEKVKESNFQQYTKDQYYLVVNRLSSIVINYYTTLNRKLPYRNYIKSLIDTFLCKLDWNFYKKKQGRSIAMEFCEEHEFYGSFDQKQFALQQIADKIETEHHPQFTLEFN